MPPALIPATESWDASSAALLKRAFDGPTTTLNEKLLQKTNHILPFSSSSAILDLGCGVAQILGRLLDTYGADLPAHTRLVAADLNSEMVTTVQRRKATEIAEGNKIWERVETAVWDAQDLVTAGVPDNEFTHVTAGLLLFTVERPRDVLAEIRRVLKNPGGVFGMTSFRSANWLNFIEDVLNTVRPGTKLTRVPTPWASVEAVRQRLEEAGFRDVSVEEVQVFYGFEEPEAMTRFSLANIPSVKAVTATMAEEDLEQAVQTMVRRLRHRFPDGAGKLEGRTIVATAKN